MYSSESLFKQKDIKRSDNQNKMVASHPPFQNMFKENNLSFKRKIISNLHIHNLKNIIC